MGRKATTCDQKMQNTDLKQGEKNNEKEKKRQRKRKIAGKRDDSKAKPNNDRKRISL